MPSECWHIPSTEDEIVDVFVEEVGQLMENIDIHMKTWVDHPDDRQALKEIRRSFHTIKGSGRMAKAIDMADLAWKVERMLNQAIAGAVPVSDQMVKLVAAVRSRIPRMAAILKNRESAGNHGDIENLMRIADGLATEPAPIRKSRDRAADDPKHGRSLPQTELDRIVDRVNEALHRSEMALQEARRASAAGKAPSEVDKSDVSAEASNLSERIDRLSREVSDILLLLRQGEGRPIVRQGGGSRSSERSVRATLASIERLRIEVERSIEESRRLSIGLRRIGWTVFAMAVLIGGVITAGLNG